MGLPELPPVDPKMAIGYEAIRYISGFTESYVKGYARAYAEEAVKQERESIAADWEHRHGFDKHGVAAAIRSRSDPHPPWCSGGCCDASS